MENTLFGILTFFLSILTFCIFYFKEHKKNYIQYFLFLFIIFYSPAVYYIFGGTSYKIFNNESFINYLWLSIFIFFVNIIFLVLKQTSIIPFIRPIKKIITVENRMTLAVAIYFAFITLVLIMYIGMYANNFTLIHYIRYAEIIKRPDSVGSIPHFYIMSTFLMMIFPSFYFFRAKKITKIYEHFIWLMLITFFSVVAGHKGLITFFMIFFWYHILEHRIDIKLLTILLILLVIYALTKGVAINTHTLSYLTESPLRRFFVTQGACMINRLYLVDINYFWDSQIYIKDQVCASMSHVDIGDCTAPTFFIGDLIVKYGYFTALLIYIIVLALIFFVIKQLDFYAKDNLFVKWNLFIIFFIIGMSEISIYSSIRIAVILFNLFFVTFLSKIKLHKTI